MAKIEPAMQKRENSRSFEPSPAWTPNDRRRSLLPLTHFYTIQFCNATKSLSHTQLRERTWCEARRHRVVKSNSGAAAVRAVSARDLSDL